MSSSFLPAEALRRKLQQKSGACHAEGCQPFTTWRAFRHAKKLRSQRPFLSIAHQGAAPSEEQLEIQFEPLAGRFSFKAICIMPVCVEDRFGKDF
jgi:hypothetical protein